MVSHLSVHGCLNVSFTAPGPGSVIRALHCIVHRVPRIVRAGICLYLIWSDMTRYDLIIWYYGDGGQDGIWFDSVCPPRPVLRGPGSVTAPLMKGPGSVCMWKKSDMSVCMWLWLCMHDSVCYSFVYLIRIMTLSTTLLEIWFGIWFCLSYIWVLILCVGLSVTPLYFELCLWPIITLCASDLHRASVSHIP